MVEEGDRDALDRGEPRSRHRVRTEMAGTTEEQEELRAADRAEEV
jgi:hypothetical protein